MTPVLYPFLTRSVFAAPRFCAAKVEKMCIRDSDDICHSRFGLNAYGYMLDFARDCVKYGIKTILTVVDVIPKENIEKCAEIAQEVGAIFRVRTYSDK